ncbi:hypothetical protein BDR07DRAFT_1379749 [Suillus spraguei]|nr:hypothetical protein BDR07DRAFT_1379749 [Suillus spraguei]
MKPSDWVREEGQRTSKIPQKIRRSEGKKSGTSVVGPVSNIQLNTSPVTAEVPENNIKKEMQKLDTSVGKYKILTWYWNLRLSTKTQSLSHLANINCWLYESTNKVCKMKGLKNTTEEHKVEYDSYCQQLSAVLGILLDLGKWGIIVYDSDKLLVKGNWLANHLSSNSILHKYKQTEEEVLVIVLKEIWAAYLKAPTNEYDEIATAILIDIHTEKDKIMCLQKAWRETRYHTLYMLSFTCLRKWKEEMSETKRILQACEN